MTAPLRTRPSTGGPAAAGRRRPPRRHELGVVDDAPGDPATDGAAPRAGVGRPTAAPGWRASPRGGDPRQQLDSALTDLGEVFAVYPFRGAMPACAHCVTPDDRRLLGRHLARIPGPVLDRFLRKSLTTWGDVDDLKRVLPEVLTRLVRRRLGVPEALVGARLRRAGWLDWPAAEAPAVHRALRALWLSTLAEGPGPDRVPAICRLGLVLSAEDDLGTYLEMWEDRLEAPGDPTARLHAVLQLADLLAPFADGRAKRLNRAFPLARRSVVSQLDHWLRQPLVVQRLAHAGDVLAPTPHGPVIARAREGMARLRTC